MVDYNPDLPDLTGITLEPHPTTAQDPSPLPSKLASKSGKPNSVTSITTGEMKGKLDEVKVNEGTPEIRSPLPAGKLTAPDSTTTLHNNYHSPSSGHLQPSPELELSGIVSPNEPLTTMTITNIHHSNGIDIKDGTTTETQLNRIDPIRSEGSNSIGLSIIESNPTPKRRKIIQRYQPKSTESILLKEPREVTVVDLPSEPHANLGLGEGEEGRDDGVRMTRSKTRAIRGIITGGVERPVEVRGSKEVKGSPVIRRGRKGRPRTPEGDEGRVEVEHFSSPHETIGTDIPGALNESNVPKKMRKSRVTKPKLPPVKLLEPSGAEGPRDSMDPVTISLSGTAEGPKGTEDPVRSDELQPMKKVKTIRTKVTKRIKGSENPEEPNKTGELIEPVEPEVVKKVRKTRVSKPKASVTSPESHELEGADGSMNSSGATVATELTNLTEPGEPQSPPKLKKSRAKVPKPSKSPVNPDEPDKTEEPGEPNEPIESEVPKKVKKTRVSKPKASLIPPDPNAAEGPDGLINPPGAGPSGDSVNLTESGEPQPTPKVKKSRAKVTKQPKAPVNPDEPDKSEPTGESGEPIVSGGPEVAKKSRKPQVTKSKTLLTPQDSDEPEGFNWFIDTRGANVVTEPMDPTESGEPQPPQKVKKSRVKVPKRSGASREPKESEEPQQPGGSDQPQGSDERINSEGFEVPPKPKKTRVTKPKVTKSTPGVEEPEGSQLAEGVGEGDGSEVPPKLKRTRVAKPKVTMESQEPQEAQGPQGENEVDETTETTEPMTPKRPKEPKPTRVRKSKVPKPTPDIPFCPSIGWDRGHYDQERSLLDSDPSNNPVPTAKRGNGVENLTSELGMVDLDLESDGEGSILTTPNPTKKLKLTNGAKKVRKGPSKYQIKQSTRESIPQDRERIAAILATKLTLPNIEDPSLFEGPSNKRTASFDLHRTDLDYDWYHQLPITLPTPSSLTEVEANLYRPPPPTIAMEKIQVVGEEEPIHLPINGSHPLPTGYIFNTGLDPYTMEHCPGGTHLAIAGRHTTSPVRLGEIQPGRGIIQLWNLQGEGYLETTLCHEFGSILSLRWLPRYAPNLLGPDPTYLGLLAVVGSTGEVYIIPVVTGAPNIKVEAIYRFSLSNLVFTSCDWSPCSHPGRLVAGTVTGDVVAWDLFTDLPEVLTRLITEEGEIATPLTPSPRYITRSHLSLITAIKFIYEPSMGLGVVTSGTDGFVTVHFWSDPHQFFRLHNQKSPVDFLATAPALSHRNLRVIYPDNTNCLRWAALVTDHKKDRRRLFHIGLTLATTLAGTDHHNLLATGTLDGNVTVTESPFSNRMRQQPEQFPIFQFRWDDKRQLLTVHCQPSLPQMIPLARPDKPILDPTPHLPPVYLRSLSWNPVFNLLLTTPSPPTSSDPPTPRPPLLNAIDLPPPSSTSTGFQLAASTTGGICIVTSLVPTSPPPPSPPATPAVEVGSVVPPSGEGEVTATAAIVSPQPPAIPLADNRETGTPVPPPSDPHGIITLTPPPANQQDTITPTSTVDPGHPPPHPTTPMGSSNDSGVRDPSPNVGLGESHSIIGTIISDYNNEGELDVDVEPW